MKTGRGLLLAAILACFLVLLPRLNEALAGGRKTGPRHELSGSILFTAWYRDSLINVAVCNVSDNMQLLKIATGTYDVGKHIYASQSLHISPDSIKLVYFPLLKKRTPRGDLKAADYVFVFTDDSQASRLIDFKHIQNLYTRYPKATLDNFIVASGKKARFSYVMNCDDSLRIILMSKSIKTHNNSLITGKPAKEILKPATEGDIKELKLPVFYEKEFIRLLEENYCYPIKHGEGATITIMYNIGEVKKCALADIPVSRYTIEPPGGGGGGHGLTFMIYDPEVIQIETLLRLSPDSEKGISSISGASSLDQKGHP